MTSNSTRLLLLIAATVFFSSALPIPASAQTVSFVDARRDFAVGVGIRPQSVAVGDFNGDGVPDLATANRNSNTVSVLLGTGDGTFQAAQSFAAGTTPVSVAVGDFNGDGRPDLAVANANSNDVSVLLGNGDGTFQTAQTFAAGTTPIFVAVGDVNGDGVSDLAVVNNGSNDVSVLLGTGDGSFQAAQNFVVGTTPVSVAVGDFNSDGKPDLAVANAGSNTVSVLLGNGDGTFQAALTFAAAGRRSVAVGDFNGDGKLDLAVASPGAGAPGGTVDLVSVLLGTGDGTFQAAPTFAAGTTPVSVAVGDFNSDGKPDLAVANSGSNTVSVLLGNGDGTFQPAQSFVVGSFPESVAVGDFNGDGRLDLAVANSVSNDVSVLLGNGDGTFQPAQSFTAGAGPVSVAMGDFNGDGKLDLAVVNGNRVSVLLGNGDGTFRGAPTFGGDATITLDSVAVGDFNGDGRLDLAVVGNVAGSIGAGFLALGNGDGTFGDGTLRSANHFGAGAASRSVAVGDFNSDGKLDVAVVNSGEFIPAGTVTVSLGNGDGTFQGAQSFAAGIFSFSVAVGDFNGDGMPDLAVSNIFSNNVSVLLGNGDGTFQAAQFFGVGTGPALSAQSVAVGDFNGDGVPDLAVVNNGSNNVSVLINNTALPSKTLTVSTAGTGSGTVTSSESPPKIDCGATCSASYESGMEVTLTATPASGSIFTGWSGGCSGTGTCTVTMNSDTVVTATFDLQTFTLSVNKTGIGSGTVTSGDGGIDCGPTCAASYTSGTVVTLTATPAFGSIFTHWRGCDMVSHRTCTVTMSAARSVTARFLGIPPPLF